MPRATIDPNDTQHHDLETLPGGFVEVRRMSYGKYLDRQTEAMEMKISRGASKEDMSGELKMMGRATSVIEFRECIVDHNLEDAEGKKLNFAQPHVLDVLDPRVGQEIGDLLAKLNTFEVALGNSVQTSDV